MNAGTKASIRLEARDPRTLRPHGRNTKVHQDADVALVAASIRRFGFRDPVGITPDGVIVEGHGRTLAAVKLGLDSVPVLVLDGLTERQLDLYRIAHNRLNLATGFDHGVLIGVLNDVLGEGMTAADLAFPDDLAESLLGGLWGDERHEDGEKECPGFYEITWDDDEQRKTWNAFVGMLKGVHGKRLKVAELVRRHVEEQAALYGADGGAGEAGDEA